MTDDTFTVKELLVEVRDDVKALRAELGVKADRADVSAVEARLDLHDQRWARLVGAATVLGLLGGGIGSLLVKAAGAA